MDINIYIIQMLPTPPPGHPPPRTLIKLGGLLALGFGEAKTWGDEIFILPRGIPMGIFLSHKP